MAYSDDTNSYDDYGYDDDSDCDDRVQCECTNCWLHQNRANPHVRAANHISKVSELVNMAYDERNRNAWHGRDMRDASDTETSRNFEAMVESRLRHTVMEHGGFCVSFSGLDIAWTPYGYSDTDEERTQRCVELGLWNDTVRQRYVQLIDDFNTFTCIQNIHRVGTSFPRFHALITAACHSSQLLLCQPYSWNCRVNDIIMKNRVNSSFSNAFLPASSVFTETTGEQRLRLLEFSGMTGKLITRMMCGMSGRLGTYEIPSYRAIALTKYAVSVTRRVHCTNACEILVGNRYVIHDSAVRRSQDGVSTKRRTYQEVLAGKRTRRSTYLEALDELRMLYPAHISNLMATAKQVQGGMSIDVVVNSNDNFLRMNDLKNLCGRRLLNMRNEAEDLNAPEDDQFKKTVRIMRFVAEFPKLFSYEISRLFGTASLRLYAATIQAQMRLAKQGCYAAMLSFAASEPRMVDAFLCPAIATTSGGFSARAKYNHVASRDEVLGPLLLKYRHHIPRTAHVVGDVCRMTF
jgi:hypothetical protein